MANRALTGAPLSEAQLISKRFGAITALTNLNFHVAVSQRLSREGP